MNYNFYKLYDVKYIMSFKNINKQNNKVKDYDKVFHENLDKYFIENANKKKIEEVSRYNYNIIKKRKKN